MIPVIYYEVRLKLSLSTLEHTHSSLVTSHRNVPEASWPHIFPSIRRSLTLDILIAATTSAELVRGKLVLCLFTATFTKFLTYSWLLIPVVHIVPHKKVDI